MTSDYCIKLIHDYRLHSLSFFLCFIIKGKAKGKGVEIVCVINNKFYKTIEYLYQHLLFFLNSSIFNSFKIIYFFFKTHIHANGD